ncbi:hypothetical protein COCMIDRAFT_31549 [Bipolaris oryzae ATCC 44560]|uniref:Uncharacterized protein n=1 Tax=Bipolaris oryzae ATCC 44560 TaxID=930090 RepID=W6ZMU1_COCMI|nr:uncharacterized protein COCMIDRAFT_31549 [Bipolaris oryzae ATCC 44560]EUC51415.1 hypothetical protein COCMIDRAFT_31549 [Bipolaris oryzae ATCC 44560]
MIRRRSLCRSTLPLLGHGHGHGTTANQQPTGNGSVLPAPFSVSSPFPHPPHACQLRPLWGGDDTRCASADDSPSWSGSILCRRCY